MARWLLAAIRSVSVLCLLHTVLSGRMQAAVPANAGSAFERAIAAGTKQDDAGQFQQALATFTRAERIARGQGDRDREAIASTWSGICDLRLFRYRAAVEKLQTAAHLALDADDRARAGVAEYNLAEIYTSLGDFGSAQTVDSAAIQHLRPSGRYDRLAQAWVQHGLIKLVQGDTAEARKSFDQAAANARMAHEPSAEAIATEYVGLSLLRENDLSAAERELNSAYAIWDRLHDKNGLSISLEHRAELELRKHEYSAALRDIDAAFASAGVFFKSAPPYYPIHVRGKILLGLGRNSEALAEFRRAVDVATTWRESAMPGDTSSTQTVALLHDVYEDYAELAAELSLERHDSNLARQAFDALARNRAASLREQLTAAYSQNSQLPSRYFELLSRIQAAQARVTLGQSSAQNEQNLKNLQLELSDLEDKIGLENTNVSPLKEKNGVQNSLSDIQRRLGPSDVLLSFCLGNTKSFLWTVTGDNVNLYRLPAQSEIANHAKAFAASVQLGHESRLAADALSRDLFAQLTPAVWGKRNWLITADGVLLDGIPFAVLSDLSSREPAQPLIAHHTLRSLPSELLLLARERNKPEDRFVGIADPIYNLADSRRAHSVALLKTGGNGSAVTLGRLAGSDREVRISAKQSGIGDVQLLTGADATSAALRDALKKAPEVIHFAVHVVSPPGQPDQAALALSLTKDNMPELLTREAIHAFRVPGSLVVLSGCASEQGLNLPSAGVIGLSRAWLLAGAAAVLVSAWPTPDDSGPFFSSFYSHLHSNQSNSLASRAAAALQQAQMDMQQKKGYRNSPSSWAAYSIVSKE